MSELTSKTNKNHKSLSDSNLREFWLGLTQPSSISIIICFTLLVLSLVTYALLARPEQVAKHYNYLAQDYTDSYAKLTGETLSLFFSEEKRPSFQVLLLGASSIREGLNDDTKIESTLAQQTNLPIEVISLLSGGQTIWESIAVLEKIAHKISGLVWIEVNPLRMAQGKIKLGSLIQQPRIGFLSEKIDSYGQRYGFEVPARIGWYGWDNKEFILIRIPNLFSNISAGSIQFQRHQYDNKLAMSKMQLQEQATRIQTEMKNYDSEVETSLNVLAELIASNNQNLQIALLESPVNPKFVNEIASIDFYNKHWSRMRKFSMENNIPYLRFAADPATQPEHYYDWFHIFNPKVRSLLTKKFAKESINLLQNFINSKIKQ